MSAPFPSREFPVPSRLDYLDGLRAVAALYVTLFHVTVGFPSGELPRAMKPLLRLLSFGHEAVAIFIVLSGYCLMLSALRSERVPTVNGEAAGGPSRVAVPFGPYIARRAFRILPPYYVTLLLSLVVIALVPALQPPSGSGTIWDGTTPAFELGPIASHLLVVHNWSPEWVHRINGPLWSVASEWQIYFFFPLVFLPAWRRGLAVLLLLAAVLSYLPLWIVPLHARSAVTWYLLLFAFGVTAAGINHSTRALETHLRVTVPWGRVAAFSAAFCAFGGIVLAHVWFRYPEVTDVLVGLATAALLIHCTGHIAEGRAGHAPRALRFLGSPALVRVGHFSYSLYLTHLPIVALCHFALLGFALAPLVHWCVLTVVATTASLAFARVFYLAVERHFVGSPFRRKELKVPTARPFA